MSRLLALGCAVLLAACSDATGLDFAERSEIRAQLSRNEAKWDGQGLADYRYSFRRVCDCPPEATAAVEIEVRNESVYRVRLLATGADVPPGATFWPTVDDLFDEIRLALDEGASAVQARFDPVYGYPLEITISWIGTAAATTAGSIVLYAGELMPIE